MLPLTRLLPAALASQAQQTARRAATATAAAGATRAVSGSGSAPSCVPPASSACRPVSWLQQSPLLDGSRRRHKHTSGGAKSPPRGAHRAAGQTAAAGAAAAAAAAAPVPPADTKHTHAHSHNHQHQRAHTRTHAHAHTAPSRTGAASAAQLQPHSNAQAAHGATPSQQPQQPQQQRQQQQPPQAIADPADPPAPAAGAAPHTVPAFLRPATLSTLAAAHVHVHTEADPPLTAASSNVFLAPASGPAVAPPAATALSGSGNGSGSGSTPSAAPGAAGDAVHPHAMVVLPNFLRPAPEPIMQRIRRWKIFPYWTSTGYVISMIGLLVTDILWLRTIMIVSNVFGIAVHYSLKFWTGIYWSLFFIAANIVHIALILVDRRPVVLSEEEQSLYDAVFSGVFSAQEYRKLLEAAEWRDLPAGEVLMTQGSEIDTVHLVSRGLCVVQQEKLKPISQEELEQRRQRGDTVHVEQRTINGLVQAVSIVDPPSAAVAAGAAAAEGATGALTAVDLPDTEVPTLGKSIATSLLQGGLAWADRFRSQSPIGGAHGRSKQPATVAHDQSSGAEESRAAVASPSAHANTSVSSTAPGPLPPSQIHLHRPAGGSDAPAPAAVVTSAASAAKAVSANDSLPDAIILPSAPVSTGAHPAAASESHHLLNVHVDSNAHAAPGAGAETKAGSAATPLPSASSVAATTTPSTSAAASTPLEPSSAASASNSGATGTVTADDDEFLGDLEDAAEEAGISNSSAEDREARRAARQREREAAKRERDAAAEKKRLMSMSALERQFGQTDAKKLAKPAPSVPVATMVTGTALTPGDQSHTLSPPIVADADTLGAPAVGASAAATQAVPASSASVSSASSSSSSSSPLSSAASPADGPGSGAPAAALPAFQRETSVVGYMRSSRLIGEMCLVAPSSSPEGGDSTYTIAPVSVTATEPTRVLTWQRASLQRLFFRLPSLAIGWYSVVSTDLVNRLHAQRASAHTTAYKHFLQGVLSDGTVSAAQKELLRDYRQRNDIPFAFHTHTLIELGWTADDWDRGSTQRGWFDWLHAKHDDSEETTHKHA